MYLNYMNSEINALCTLLIRLRYRCLESINFYWEKIGQGSTGVYRNGFRVSRSVKPDESK